MMQDTILIKVKPLMSLGFRNNFKEKATSISQNESFKVSRVQLRDLYFINFS